MTKREIIIQTAHELFLKHGFKKISVDEICRTAGVSRKTYYTYFRNKEEVIKQVISDIADFGFALYDDIFNEESLTFAQKMAKGVLAKIELSKKWSMEFFTDLISLEKGELFDFYHRISEQSFKITAEFLESAQRKGEIDPKLNLHYIMWLMQKQYEHINEPELLAMFPSLEELTRQMTQVFVSGIMPVKE